MADSQEHELVRLERRPDGVAVVTLTRPKVNALSGALLDRLRAVAGELNADPPGAVVVTGSERFFAAGAEISEFGDADRGRVIGRRFLDTLNAVAEIPRMVIAVVSGYALGGGCELAMACDYRIVTESAVFGQPEILLGIIPGGGGTQRLARLVGPARAKELILTGRQVKADEAARIGLADRVLPTFDDAMTAALELGASLAAGALAAQALAKKAIDRGLAMSLEAGLQLEQDLFVEVFRTGDAGVGVASFLEHGPGKASFTGR
jgi:enoyl-CoA hydratase/carnithine racemase